MDYVQKRSRRPALIPVDSGTLSAEDTKDIQRRTCVTPAFVNTNIQRPLLKNPFLDTSTTFFSDTRENLSDDQNVARRSSHEKRDKIQVKVNMNTPDKKIWGAFRCKWRKRNGRKIPLLHQTNPRLRNNRLSAPRQEDTDPECLTENIAHPSGPSLPPSGHDLCDICQGCAFCG